MGLKYVSIDIETSGINPNRHQILSVGAVIEEAGVNTPIEKLPSFYCVIPYKEIVGEPFALEMNRELIKEIKEYQIDPSKNKEKFLDRNDVAPKLREFLVDNGLEGTINVAGKNFEAFDKKFLEGLPHWNIKYHRRVLDPSILCVDWEADEVLPNLDLCKKRWGVGGKVTHNALDDTRDVIKVLRKNYDIYDIS